MSYPLLPAIPYQGDAHLAELLRAHGVDRNVEAVGNLIGGVNAAPDGESPDA